MEGVETERSSEGTASRAREGEMDGEGEDGRCCGDVAVLSGGLEDVVFAIFVGLEGTREWAIRRWLLSAVAQASLAYTFREGHR